MKKLKEFGSFIFLGGVALGIIGFILLMTTPAITAGNSYITLNYSGINAIFGAENVSPLGVALTAWILTLVAILGGICAFVCDLLKVKLPDLAALGIKCLVAILLLVAGILAFCVTAEAGGGSIGAGWVIGAILLLLGAIATACPVVLSFIK